MLGKKMSEINQNAQQTCWRLNQINVYTHVTVPATVENQNQRDGS